MLNDWSVVSEPSAGGMLPPSPGKLLMFSVKSDVSEPRAGGMVPVIEVPPMYSDVSDVSAPICAGIVPEMGPLRNKLVKLVVP
jgi:hypothetical protein